MLELFATRACPYCAELRERLDWEGREYVEYDVETDDEARRRFLALARGNPLVPLLVDDGRVEQIGWQGRGCAISG